MRILAYADNIGITNRRFDRTIEIIRHSIVSELHSFSLIVCDKFEERSLFNEDFLAEFPVYHVRRLLVQAMCAISLMEVGDETDNRVRSRALEDVNYPCFSHEAVVPAFLAVFWAKEQFRSDRRNEIELISLLGTIVSATKSGESYSPYHSYDDILKHRFKDFLGINFDELDLENPKNYSHFALPVYYMVARRNWKRTSKMYWPDITDIVNNNFLCNDAAGFSAFRSDDGHNYSYFAKYPSTWEGMISNIPRSLTSPVPKKAQLDIPVFILYLIFFPFRANVDILLYIDRQVTRAWY
ncbi:MAG: hypothetical protein JJ969_02740 [Rhizobiaceae bacterium]|nr:hypothetical protein [Rhizobiaceae bacterium]